MGYKIQLPFSRYGESSRTEQSTIDRLNPRDRARRMIEWLRRLLDPSPTFCEVRKFAVIITVGVEHETKVGEMGRLCCVSAAIEWRDPSQDLQLAGSRCPLQLRMFFYVIRVLTFTRPFPYFYDPHRLS